VTLSESAIKDSLESVHEATSENDISDGQFISQEPLLAIKGGIKDSALLLQVRLSLFVFRGSNGSPSEDTSEHLEKTWSQSSVVE